MSDDRAYRVVVRFEKEQERFTASIPELGVKAEGTSRAQAIVRVEEALEGRFQALADGETLPAPIDALAAAEPITIKLSAAAHRDLAFAAQQDNMSVAELAAELVARGLGAREGARGGPPRRNAPPPPRQDAPRDPDAQPQHFDRPQGDRPRGRQREGYHPEHDNQANFLDYVRNMERGGGNQGGGRGRGRR